MGVVSSLLVNKIAKINDFAQRRAAKRIILSAATKEAEEIDQAQEDSSLETAIVDESMEATVSQFESIVSPKAMRMPKNDFKDFLHNKVSIYIQSEIQLKALFEFIEHNDRDDIFNKTQDTLNKLINDPEEQDEATISALCNSLSGNIAAIYAVLNFLLDEITKKALKKTKLLMLLKQLLSDMEHEQASYLFEFFQLMKHPAIGNNHKIANGMANLASGNVTVANIRDTMSFIETYLDNDFSNLVSKCLRLRTHVLERISKDEYSFEDKSELSQYVLFEKNLIIVSSVYNQVRNFKTTLSESKVWHINLSEHYAAHISALLSFSSLTVVSDSSVNHLLRGLGISAKDQSLGFRNKIMQLIEKLPLALFNNQATNKQKIIAGIRKSLEYSENLREERVAKDTVGFPKARDKKIIRSYI